MTLAPKRDWVFLPPSYRPLALALSIAVVALVVWDKAHSPLESGTPPNSWEGTQDTVAAAEAPVSQMDLSGHLQEVAPGKPIEVVEEKNRTDQVHSEEERSAINERLYQGLEQEKKRMGIVRIIEKDSDLASAKVIVLKNAEALQTAWAAAGLVGAPPAVDFSKNMALFLVCPSGCGIVSLRTKKNYLTALYRDSGFENPSARVRAVKTSAKPVVLVPAP